MSGLSLKQKKALFFALLLIPVVFFVVNVLIFSINLPFLDDYTAILLFLNRWADAKSPVDQFNLVMEPLYDHRVVLIRLVSLAVWKIFGAADLKIIMMAGMAGLLLGAFAFYHSFKWNREDLPKPLVFLPVVLLFLTPIYSENLYQANASATIFCSVTFGISALVLLENKREKNILYFILALFLVVMAFFAHREGLVFLFTGLLLLLYRRKWIRAGIWTAVAAASWYFYGHYGISGGGGISIGIDPALFGRYVFYFFSFIGNVFGINTMSDYYLQGGAAFRFVSVAAPVAAGVLVCAGFVVLTVRKYYEKNPLIYSILLSAFVIAVGATLQRSEFQPVVSRYRIVTILFYVCLYVAFLETFSPGKFLKPYLVASIAGTLVFHVAVTAMKYPPVIRHRDELVTTFMKWKKTGDGLIPIAWNPSDPRPILNESIRKKIYRLPPEFVPERQPK